MEFCTRPDVRPALAVFGIFTIESHTLNRQIIRKTWLQAAQALKGRLSFPFVLHGKGASSSVIAEASRHGDTIFIDEPAAMSYRHGQLRKTWAWLGCVVQMWPEASLVGRADDDIWLDPSGVERHLRASLALAGAQLRQRRLDVQLYWGAFETYHWDTWRNIPSGHGFGFGQFMTRNGSEHCLRRALPVTVKKGQQKVSYGAIRDTPGAVPAWSASTAARRRLPLEGPFHFAKGPLYCMSHGLAARLTADISLRRQTADIMALPIRNTDVMWPFEDVWIGYALAQIASQIRAGSGSGPEVPSTLVAVDMVAPGASSTFLEGHGLWISAGTLVWHMSTKIPRRIEVVHAWRQRHACDPGRMQLRCSSYQACTGGKWQRCTSWYPNRQCAARENLRWPNGTIKAII